MTSHPDYCLVMENYNHECLNFFPLSCTVTPSLASEFDKDDNIPSSYSFSFQVLDISIVVSYGYD